MNKENYNFLKKMKGSYELSSDKKGLNKWFKRDGYYHIHSDEMNPFEQKIYKNLSNNWKKEIIYRELTNEMGNPELKYYSYGFECPDLSKPLTKEQKDNIYNKLLNQFQEQLKEFIYNEN